jgi:excisionase family DNA binding protein
MRTMPDTKVLTVRELATYLHVHQTTIYRLLKNRELPAFKVGSDWRFNVETIDQWRMGKTARPERQRGN